MTVATERPKWGRPIAHGGGRERYSLAPYHKFTRGQSLQREEEECPAGRDALYENPLKREGLLSSLHTWHKYREG